MLAEPTTEISHSTACEVSGDLYYFKSVDLADQRVPAPSLDVMENNKAISIAFKFLVDRVNSFQLIPHASSSAVKRHIDTVAIAAGCLRATIDAVALDQLAVSLRLDNYKPLAECMAQAQTNMYSGDDVVSVTLYQIDKMRDRGVRDVSQILESIFFVR